MPPIPLTALTVTAEVSPENKGYDLLFSFPDDQGQPVEMVFTTETAIERTSWLADFDIEHKRSMENVSVSKEVVAEVIGYAHELRMKVSLSMVERKLLRASCIVEALVAMFEPFNDDQHQSVSSYNADDIGSVISMAASEEIARIRGHVSTASIPRPIQRHRSTPPIQMMAAILGDDGSIPLPSPNPLRNSPTPTGPPRTSAEVQAVLASVGRSNSIKSAASNTHSKRSSVRAAIPIDIDVDGVVGDLSSSARISTPQPQQQQYRTTPSPSTLKPTLSRSNSLKLFRGKSAPDKVETVLVNDDDVTLPYMHGHNQTIV